MQVVTVWQWVRLLASWTNLKLLQMVSGSAARVFAGRETRRCCCKLVKKLRAIRSYAVPYVKAIMYAQVARQALCVGGGKESVKDGNGVEIATKTRSWMGLRIIQPFPLVMS